jgi:hypothetical protein
VLDRVWVLQTRHFKKFLEVVFEWLSLPLEVTFSSHYEPLAGVVGFHPTTAVTGRYGKATW